MLGFVGLLKFGTFAKCRCRGSILGLTDQDLIMMVVSY
jgi:hypothetical protein